MHFIYTRITEKIAAEGGSLVKNFDGAKSQDRQQYPGILSCTAKAAVLGNKLQISFALERDKALSVTFYIGIDGPTNASPI